MNELQVIENSGVYDLTKINDVNFKVIDENKMNEINDFISFDHQELISNFSKSQSNFMDTLMVFNSNTALRNIRQISAEIEKKKIALSEAHFKLRRKEVEIKRNKTKLLANNYDQFEKELIEIEIEESIFQRNQMMTYIEASLKTILNMKQQYESILKNKGIDDVSEIDFEKEEEEYHIKKAVHQAFEDIVALGRISVGNNKYLLQIGLMPNVIHNIWTKFLSSNVSHDKNEFYKVIDEIYNVNIGCSKKEIERRGIENTYHKNSVLQIYNND